MPSLDTLAALLDALRNSPDQYADQELAEISATAQEVQRLATHLFVERLLARSRAQDGGDS